MEQNLKGESYTASISKYEQVGIRGQINKALFEINNPIGRITNLGIMTLIILSVIVSMVGTVDSLDETTLAMIHKFEVFVTLMFALEYILRLFSARMPFRYATGFYGLVDLCTVLPLFIFGNTYLAIRLLRIVRLLKLLRYLRAFRSLISSMRDVIETILIVIVAIAILILAAGNLIHIIEPETFSNAFEGCYWSLVTMTTVGYGDIVPKTWTGRVIASVLMLFGISLFAMLTATISVRIARSVDEKRKCTNCGLSINVEYNFCPQCGNKEH